MNAPLRPMPRNDDSAPFADHEVKYSEDGLISELRNLIATVTRYPHDVLSADADMEHDLGIDSVKRGEILVAVRRHFQLAPTFQVPAEEFRTIRFAAKALSRRFSGGVQQDHGASDFEKRGGNIDPERPIGVDLLAKLTKLVAEVTRYPVDVLRPDADLEHDLGIDSVKRGEIMVAMRRLLKLPNDYTVAPESFRTLAMAASVLSNLGPLKGQPTQARPDEVETIQEQAVVAAASPEMILPRLRNVVAGITRYPEEILSSGASFEHDLGIDSVKRGEIMVAVRKEFGLSKEVIVPPESFSNLDAASEIIARLVQGQSAGTSVPSTDDKGKLHAATAQHKKNSSPSLGLDASTLGQSPAYLRELTDIFSENRAKPFLGKTALVTGSGRGIGRDIARSLAKLGATVIVNAFHSRAEGEQTAAEIEQSGGKAYFIWGSVANPAQRIEMFAHIEKLGGLDYFISNASNGLIAPFEQINDEHWAKGFQTNLVGLHQCALLAAPLMAKRGGGKIITLSTPVSNRHVADFSCMAALKASVESLTRSMAVEFEKYRITANCISAGAVYGDLIQKFPDSEQAIHYWEDKSLGKRLVYSQEICNFINFLLSGAADAINGSVLVIDGGITIRL